jgi:acetyl-CoA synthetase
MTVATGGRADRTDEWWRHRRTPAHDEFRRARDLLIGHGADHETAYRRFHWPRPGHFNWALEWFDVVADGNDSTALYLPRAGTTTNKVSYDQLSRESDRTAAWLRDVGVRRTDHVLIVLSAQRELWECLLACLKIGAVVVPAYPTLTAAEVADRVRRGGIGHVICRADLTDRFAVDVPGLRMAVPGNRSGWLSYRDRETFVPHYVPDGPTASGDVAFCYFTSGTTAAPKLVAHTHASYPIGHLSSMYWNGLRPGDRHLNISDPGWAKHAWSGFFAPLNAEATIVVPPGRLDPADVPTLLERHRIDSLCCPPGVWRALLPHLRTARPALREAVAAGQPLPDHVTREVRAAWGVTVRDGYGQSETTAMIGTSPGLVGRVGWLGKALPGYRIILRHDDDTDTDTDGRRTGEICVPTDGADRPVGLMAGYLDESQVIDTSSVSGLYRTGDIGERDEHGYIRILGRADDVFKSFGHRVSPYEVEAVLDGHPAVAAAAVIPRPHEEAGAVPHAVVELRPGVRTAADDILRYCATLLGPPLLPVSLSIIDRLPRTASGKIRRALLTHDLTHRAERQDRG